MILKGYGVIDLSPIQVSEALRQLRVSHTIEGGYMRHMVYTIDGLSKVQPAWPIVVDTLKAVPKVRTKKERMIYLICDSRAALANTNADKLLWPESRETHGGLSSALRLALNSAHVANEEWALVRTDPSIDDFVNASSKPSFLNHVQTAVYKINPYDLRKEVQSLVILYLSGKVSPTKMRAKLKSSFKLEALLLLMTDPQAGKLRAACEEALRKKVTVEEIAKRTGVASFDLLYILNSARKLSA